MEQLHYLFLKPTQIGTSPISEVNLTPCCAESGLSGLSVTPKVLRFSTHRISLVGLQQYYVTIGYHVSYLKERTLLALAAGVT